MKLINYANGEQAGFKGYIQNNKGKIVGFVKVNGNIITKW